MKDQVGVGEEERRTAPKAHQHSCIWGTGQVPCRPAYVERRGGMVARAPRAREGRRLFGTTGCHPASLQLVRCVKEGDLQDLFGQCGRLQRVFLAKDMTTYQSKALHSSRITTGKMHREPLIA